MNRALLIILSTVTLDSIGFGLIFPILPSLLRDVIHEVNVAPVLGGLIALYALMQFVFSPILGMLSDRYGRRPVLLVSLAGAAIDYLVMAFAPQLWVLVVGRAIAGITSANMAVATAYIADISTEDQRAQRFGFFSACFGIGFIIGPILGGVLGEHWIRLPFLVAAGLNALNFAIALFVLPESRHPGEQPAFKLSQLNPFGPMRWAFGFKVILPMMAIYFMFNLMGQVYGTSWTLYSEDKFAYGPMMVGLSLGAYGLFHAVAQAFATGPAVKRFGEKGALLLGMAFECTGLIAIAFATQGWILFAAAPLFALGGIGMPALQALLSSKVGPDKQGQLQGVLASLMSLASIFGPLIYTWLYFVTRDGFTGTVWLFTVALYLCCLPFILSIRPRVPAESV